MLRKKPDFGAHLPAILIVSALQFFVCEFLVAGSWRGNYSYTQNFISDLGVPYCGLHGDAPCSSSSVLMAASLVVFAAALLIAAQWIGHVAAMPAVASVFLVLMAIGAALVGLVRSNVNWPLHSLGASLFLIFGGCALLTIGLCRAVFRRNAASMITAPLGLLGLAGYFCYVNSWQLGLGPGGIERVSAYSVFVGFVAAVAMVSSSQRIPHHQTTTERQLA
jgi:hypothetical membrane protein